MSPAQPVPHLDTRYSSEGTSATPWPVGRRVLEEAEVFWLITVRPNGRPHGTPLLAVWLDGAIFFCTGPDERKARNLKQHSGCLLLTGDNALPDGMDIAVEGEAMQVSDEAVLGRVAQAYLEKYGEDWRYLVRDGALVHAEESLRGDDPGRVLAFRVAPNTVFGFGKGTRYSQTRWAFEPPGRDRR